MLLRFVAALAALAFAGGAFAQLLTERKVFTLPQYTTVGGRTLKDVRIGYESYGKLNAAGDNAIYIAHFLTANSHAAGRYKADDKAAGYWDSLIGPGKPFDTDRYFVLSADTLVNVNSKDTGPASFDPDSGRPWGMRFPIVTIRDFVNVQKALADSLGVKKFAAVAGPSMGSLQVMEWAAAYPDMVARAIPVVPAGLAANAYIVETVGTWATPIYDDPNWIGGHYYGHQEQPVKGVAEALKLAVLSARHPDWADRTHGRKWAAADRNPLQDWTNKFHIEESFDKVTAGRAGAMDANAFLYLVRAIQLYQVEGVGRIKAKVLAIPARSDLFFPPDYTRKMVATLKSQGTPAEVFEIDGDGGHLDGILDAAKAGEAIRAFLQK